MKKCNVCGKTYEDDRAYCSECGYALIDTSEAAAPAPAAAVASAAPAAAAAVPAQKIDFAKLLSKIWLLLASLLGYALSWVSSGNMCIFGTLICCGCAVAAWAKIDGEKICKNVIVGCVTTLIGVIALIELFVYAIP